MSRQFARTAPTHTSHLHCVGTKLTSRKPGVRARNELPPRPDKRAFQTWDILCLVPPNTFLLWVDVTNGYCCGHGHCSRCVVSYDVLRASVDDWFGCIGRYARSQGMLFFETSAKEDTNVGMMFRSTARAVLQNIEDATITVGNPQSGVKVEDFTPSAARSVSAPQDRPRKKGCC